MIPLRPYFSSYRLAAGVCAWSLFGIPQPSPAQDQSHDREPDHAEVQRVMESPLLIAGGYSEPVKLLTETGVLPVCGTPHLTGAPEPEPPSCHAPSSVKGTVHVAMAAPADSNDKAPSPSEEPKASVPQPQPSTPPASEPSNPVPAPLPSPPKPDKPAPAAPAGTPVEPPRMFDGGVPPAAADFQGTIKGCVETIGRHQSSFRMKIISAAPDKQGKEVKPESLISAVVLVMQGMDRSPENKWTPKPGHHEWITAVKPGDLVTVHVRYSKPFNGFRLMEVPPAPVPCDIPLPPKPAVSKPAPVPAPAAPVPSPPPAAPSESPRTPVASQQDAK